MLQLDDPEGQGLQEVAAALERRVSKTKGSRSKRPPCFYSHHPPTTNQPTRLPQALMLAHHEGEGRNFVPLPDATLVLAQERRGARQALGLALETAMDVGGLEDENRELCRQIAEPMVGGILGGGEGGLALLCLFLGGLFGARVIVLCLTLSLRTPHDAPPPPQRVLREKEELLAKAHEEHKERITLLKRLQDLEMDNADLKLIMQKSYMAEVRR